MKEISVKWRRFYVFFYISFRSLLINTRLVFISYFDSAPFRKGYRGLEYRCLFYHLHLFLLHFWWFILLNLDFMGVFLFAFLIIYVGTFGFCRLFRNRFDSSQVKRDLISSIMNFVCTLPLELPKDLRFRVFLNYGILRKFQNLTLVIRIVVLILLKINFFMLK